MYLYLRLLYEQFANTMSSGNIFGRHPADLAPSSRRLRIFDFDDTLVKTDSRIYYRRGDGDEKSMSPGEYAVYTPHKDDIFDYRDFRGTLGNPREIKWVATILKRVYAKYGPSGATILTARGAYKPVRQFLVDIGVPGIFVVALNSPNPQAKADYIEQRIIQDHLTLVEFFDDSVQNIEAVDELQTRYPDVKIVTRLMKHG